MIKAHPSGGYITGWSLPNPETGKPTEVFYQGKTIKRTGIPPLFPCWNESGTKLRKHGFARDVEWQVRKQADSEIEMVLDSEHIKPIVENEYPYDFSVTIKAASTGNTLSYSMIVENRGNKGMEIAPAIHPYFNIPHSEKTRIKTEGIEGFDAKQFDWDTTPPDNNYPFFGSAKIITPSMELTIEDNTVPPVIRRLVVWSQPKSAEDFDFVCFEPVTALEGAIKRKEIFLQPGKTWRMDLRFTVSFR